VTLLRSLPKAQAQPQFLLRPPGVHLVDPDPAVFSRCIRCGTCMRICPTGVLQPAVTETGVDSIGTPVLIPRLGYCDYACNACGQSCPVQAIPPLSLAEKQVQVIGKAYIDKDRCLPWADHRACFVCEEMCPLPQKAIRLEAARVQASDGSLVMLEQPVVLRDLCIGCGICETRCPLGGESAIRIYTPQGSEALYFGEG
jgi:ferredoxin